jgi:hypothetical protein
MRLRTARALDKSVVLVATLCLAANSYHIPSAVFWQNLFSGRRYLLLFLLAVVGIFGALTPFEMLTARARADTALTVRRQVHHSFGQLLTFGGSVSPPLQLSDLGLHVWRRRRTVRHPLQGVLARVATYRLGTTPLTRSFTPPKGVGVVGLCWKHNQEVGFDVARLASQLATKEEFDRYVEAHDGDEVMNFDRTQFNRVKHRGAVFATPVRNGRNRFVGCVSVDASRGYEELNHHELWSEMNLVAIVVSQMGFENV